ncbi:MAG: lytic transglycosylase domain-containing protein [Alphaproteobacteria bacterium]|nr:lytic transglycosylase domain-containing protein [Alphaproteobacteria bacterium]
MQEIARVAGAGIEWGKTYTPNIKRSAQQRKDINAFKKAMLSQAASEHFTYALKLLDTDPRAALMTKTERDILRSYVAKGYYHRGDMKAAYRLASQTVSRSGNAVPLSAWIGGLISWREKNYKQAAAFFEKAGDSPYASGWTQAAGAFWAARSHMRAGDFKDVTPWMEKASTHPRTFYGLLATRALGKDFNFNWDIPAFTTAHQNLIASFPAGARAMALVDIGQRSLAQAELLRLDTDANAGLSTALLAYAEHAQLPKLSLRLANLLSNSETGFYDAALYPDGPWKPGSGYKLDPALVYAMIRQESTFNPQAKSPKGALGLMQVMPLTAKHVGLEDEAALLKPAVNLDVAQDYILDLFQRSTINGDLVKLLVAYNAGPGNLANWMDKPGATTDPLLFIESIPVAETRNYVEKIMANYWMYQRRQGLQTPSLDRLAQGLWVSYAEMQKIQPFETASSN